MQIINNEFDDVEIDYIPKRALHSEATMRQSLAFDMVPDAMLVDDWEALGLGPCSQEVFDAEYVGSQQRRNNIGPLLPLLTVLARLATEVQNAAILVKQAEDPDEETPDVDPQIVLSSAVGIVATLIDLGVVHLPHAEIGVVE